MTDAGFVVFRENVLWHLGHIILYVAIVLLDFYYHHVVIKLAVHLRMLHTFGNADDIGVHLVEQFTRRYKIVAILVGIAFQPSYKIFKEERPCHGISLPRTLIGTTAQV